MIVPSIVESWGGNPLELGPIYPLGGLEFVMLSLGVLAWLGWTFWQARHENLGYSREAQAVKRYEDLLKALRLEQGGPERIDRS
jgi:hypothetical protein